MIEITTEEDNEKALKRIEELWGAEENTIEGNELDELLDAVVKFEEMYYKDI